MTGNICLMMVNIVGNLWNSLRNFHYTVLLFGTVVGNFHYIFLPFGLKIDGDTY